MNIDPNALLQCADAHVPGIIGLIRGMVEMESPSDDPASLARFADRFVETAAAFGGVTERAEGGHLECRFPGESEEQILVLGHYDTVWPIGTLQRMAFREEQGRLWGPGVLDMKGGIAMFLMAMRALQEQDIVPPRCVLLQLNADEEIGSPSSRELTERNARASRAVLVVEPGTGLTGKLKTARKGVGAYRLTVSGRASHSGVDFEAGASAVLELAHQLIAISRFTDLDSGVTVNPGVIQGGTRSNVVAAGAVASIDVRVARKADAALLEKRFQALKATDPRCSLQIEGGLNRPPMERTPAIAKLFSLAQKLGTQIGLAVEESSTGGGSDGNFTAALGVPTLDGLGAVGEGAHAPNESILTGRLADRTALLALLLAHRETGA